MLLLVQVDEDQENNLKKFVNSFGDASIEKGTNENLLKLGEVVRNHKENYLSL
ncbi:MAG: hypothetical protein OXE77_06205 [Flavobacteriaceae bacterium]|nr:hypothetical protein [Flavobacteriaceae bacterium]MCY4267372.1 hypothetical protein [Flavobacteriaceae bacterium]MCY4299574.1 hypothetical protein [Flavobacteriaceae bacterium]